MKILKFTLALALPGLWHRGRCLRPWVHYSPAFPGQGSRRWRALKRRAPPASSLPSALQTGKLRPRYGSGSLCQKGNANTEDAPAQPRTPGSLPMTLSENFLPDIFVGHQGRGWSFDVLGEGVQGAACEQPLVNFADDGQQQDCQQHQR